jgi:hypothetical protein
MGANTLTLTANNTYTGATTINAGRLAVTGTLGSTAVTVNGGASLGGTGKIGGSVTVVGGATSSAQGAIDLRDGATGTLTLSSGLTLGSGGGASNLYFDLAGTSTGVDLLSITGGVTLSGTAQIYLNDLSATSLLAGNYTLISAASGLNSSNFTLGSTTLVVGGTTYNLSLANSTATSEILTVSAQSQSQTQTTYTLAATAGSSRIILGGTTGVTTTIVNSGTGTADSLSYNGLSATATSGTVSGASTSGTLANNSTSGSNSGLTFTGTATGVQTITPTVTSATNTTIGGAATLTTTGTASVDVVANRVVSASSVNLGNVLVGKTTGSVSSALSSTGSHLNFTDVTVASGTTTSGGVAVANASAQTFDGTNASGSVAVSGSFASSGITSGTVSVTTTGEGLTGEVDAPVNVDYTASVYAAAHVTASNGGTTLANDGTGSLVASAKVESNSINTASTQNASAWTGLTPTIAAGSNAAVASFNSTGRLNGTYTGSTTISVTNVATDGSAIQGSASGDVLTSSNYGIIASITGNKSTSRTNTYSAQILSGGSYAGYGLTSGVGNATTATLLGGTASASTNVTMSFDTSLASGKDSANRSSDILTLSGIQATGGTGFHGSTLTDKFVLEITYNPATTTGLQYIALYDSTLGEWVNAISGNSDHVLDGLSFTSGGTGIGTFVTGTYNASVDNVLGYYGYDAATNTAWAVLDNSAPSLEYAVVPEPGTWAMLVGGFGMLVGMQRMRRRAVK